MSNATVYITNVNGTSTGTGYSIYYRAAIEEGSRLDDVCEISYAVGSASAVISLVRQHAREKLSEAFGVTFPGGSKTPVIGGIDL